MYNKDETMQNMNNVIKGIKLIPSMLKSFKSNLKDNNISPELVNDIVNNDIEKCNLSKDKKITLLRVLYEMLDDESLNPDNQDEFSKEDAKDGDDYNEDLYYNFNAKREFADTYQTKETSRVTMTLFRRSASLENELEKDLYDFNVMELERFFKSLNATTIKGVQTYISRVQRYIEFAIENNFKEGDINFAKVFDRSNRVQNLLDKDALDNLFFSKEEIMRMAMEADNAQDGVIIALLFDGVSFKNNYEEIINLKIKNFNEEEQTVTTEKGRVIHISSETASLIRQASDQDATYVSVTGKTHRVYKVSQGKNIVRGLRSPNVTHGVIGQRIYRTTEIYGFNYMNATNISINGRIHMVKKLMSEGSTMDDAVTETLHRFGAEVNNASFFDLKRKVQNLISDN